MGRATYNKQIPGPYGPIPLRHYQPDSAPVASLLWLHGGSFLGGDLDMPEADLFARRLTAYRIQVVTVDYRLAPVPPEFAAAAGGKRDGVHYPVAVEEVEHVLQTLQDRASHDWALGGASAGGALAASAAIRLRNRQRTPPSALVLAYPLLHRTLPDPSPHLINRLRDAELSPTAAEVAVMNRNYLGDNLAPDAIRGAFAGDEPLHDLPPMLVLDSDIDVLRASSQRFAASVVLDGGDIHYLVEPGTHHGHLNTPGAAADRSTSHIAEWLLMSVATRRLRQDVPS